MYNGLYPLLLVLPLQSCLLRLLLAAHLASVFILPQLLVLSPHCERLLSTLAAFFDGRLGIHHGSAARVAASGT